MAVAGFRGQTCSLGVDDTFGPVVDLCARQFDFTLLFEQSILSIPPNALFLLIAPWRIWSLRSYTKKTRYGWLSFAKMLMAVALLASYVVLLVYYTQLYTPRTTLSIPATVLALASALVIVPLSYLEDRRSVRPSTLINSYLALSVVLDIPQIRTLYLVPGHLQRHLASIFSVSFAVKIILLGIEARNKRYSLIDGYRTLATETTSGIFSRSLFVWMNELFKRGYKKAICFEDLGPIDDSLGSANLHHQLLEAWRQHNHMVKQPLLKSLWRALKWSILSPVPPRLCYSAFLFAQPFLINRAISYLSQPQDTLEYDIGYGLIGAAACTYLGIALSNALFQRQLYRHITMVRGSLVSLIYSQSLSIEDQVEDPSAAVTLMSTDVDRICQSLTLLHDLWARPLELAIGITLLALQIGLVCIVPIIIVVITVMFDSRVTVMIGGKVKVWSDAVQRRISLTADVLSGMKSVKMLGLTRPLHWMLQKERLHELGLQAKFRWSVVWLNTLGNVPPALTAAVTFIAYTIKAHVAGTGSLNATQVFTSLALINLITTPASELLGAFPLAASCLGCLARIQTHLLQPSRLDHRIFTTSKTSLTGEKTDDHDKGEIVVQLSQIIIPSIHDTSDPLLQNFDFKFRQNSLTMIVGPSGSGKSTLLRTILGEARCQGTISISSPRITYCSQTPWLFTGTIKQNICGLAPDEFDKPWYTSVLYTCVLDSYILLLPHGDNTRIEGKTSTLSGGQKQRLILARALYRRPRVLLLDDILSALDIKTETMVMTRLFGTDGLMSKLDATVVLVTHTQRWKSIADTIVTLDGTGNSMQFSRNRRLENAISSIRPGPPDLEKASSETKISDTLGTEPVNGDLEPVVHVSAQPPERGGEARDYIYYFKSVRLSLMLLFISSAAAQTVCYYISQTVLSWWTAADGSDEKKWLPIYLLLSVGNAIMYGVTVWVMFLRIVPESAANLHRILLDVVMDAPYSFYTTIDVGMILNRFSQDMTLIESQLPTGVLCTLIYLFWTLGSLALISMGSSYMALSIPIVLFTLFVVQRVYLRTSRRLRAIELELRSPLYSHFMESLKGLSSLRVLNWQDDFTSHMLFKLDTSQVPYYLLYCAQRWLQLVLDLIVAGLAIFVMALAVQLRSSTVPSSLGLSLNSVLGFNQTLALLLQFWTQLEVSLGAIRRTREFEEQTPVETPPPSISSSLSLPPPLILTASWPSHGHISIRNLSAHYNPSSPALTNITVSILPGSKIGICGRSGSGKSSLLSCILRLLEPSSGSIIIDSIDLKFLGHETLRERILTIPQEPFLLGRDVRWNLDPRGQIHAGKRDKEMIHALRKVLLWSLIEKRGGLSALVTTDFLSQGQKQLFSLARAILFKGSRSFSSSSGPNPTPSSKVGVLLLDEATSNIDRATDTLMQRVIREEFAEFTILVVAHRLETILDSDRVLVLDEGRVVEFDAPQTLLGTESVFKELCMASEHEREGK